MSGMVTVRIIRAVLAPLASAASSSLGSMARNAPAVMMNATGVKFNPCTQPMPVMVVMLSGASIKPKRIL